jgi:hypothetical protein
LGAGAAVGRALVPADERPDAAPVAVLADAFWRERLGADPAVLGRSVVVDGVRHEVVGVMPPDFRLPRADVALWVPARIDPAAFADYWWMWRLRVVARLAPGVTPAAAEAETRAIVMQVGRHEYPQRMDDSFGRDLRVVPLQASLAGGVRSSLLLLLAASGVVLLVAVVNATGLALVRAAGRERELTVRAAVGAGRGRIVRQLVAEGLVVAGLAGVAGGGTRLGPRARGRRGASPDAPGAAGLAFDGRAFAVALALAAAAGVLAAVVPAWGAARAALGSVLSGASGGAARGATAGLPGRRALERLVVAQLALGVGAGRRRGAAGDEPAPAARRRPGVPRRAGHRGRGAAAGRAAHAGAGRPRHRGRHRGLAGGRRGPAPRACARSRWRCSTAPARCPASTRPRS